METTNNIKLKLHIADIYVKTVRLIIIVYIVYQYSYVVKVQNTLVSDSHRLEDKWKCSSLRALTQT